MRKPYGSGVAEIVPYQCFQTKTGWLMIAAGNDNLFRKFCEVLDLRELVSDPAFATNSARVVNRERLIPMVEKAVAQFDAEDLGRRLDALGVPNAPLLGVEDVAKHPQLKALDITAQCDDGLSLVSIPDCSRRQEASNHAPRAQARRA
ncbi:crotonobetainyl-CoA:carnitine CoA-transferase CaiB-like acyl-CoA transferase [Bradyrhizobium sp. LM3.6]